jgi:restriction endonuclease Mrr
MAAVERYRDAARRVFVRKLAELPGHAQVELAIMALERAGVAQLRAVRRTGANNAESHFAATLRAPTGDLRVALVIRRDGREVGRERVTELRGSLHHYAGATMGWIVTTGSVLSGAREEAEVAGVAPIALTDGAGLAKLCEQHGVAVIETKLPVSIVDVDLLDALRST